MPTFEGVHRDAVLGQLVMFDRLLGSGAPPDHPLATFAVYRRARWD